MMHIQKRLLEAKSGSGSPGVFCRTSTAGVHSRAVAFSFNVQLQGSKAKVALLPVQDDAEVDGSDDCKSQAPVRALCLS